MEKLKVGTKVRIKSDLVTYEKYGATCFVSAMEPTLGVETTIKEFKGECIRLECDGGRWNYTPEMFDVIKESVTMEKKSFAIPEGCKVLNVSEESGRLVIEFEPVEKFNPKRGDIISLRSGGSVVIYSVMYSSHGIFNGKIYNDIVSNDMQCWRPANEAETAQLFTALEKEGLKWNAETMEVERLRWKPRHGERYYCLSTDVDMRNDSNEHDEARFKVGDCFKTADDRLAAIEKVKALLLSL